jgi:hypothetical protein
MVRCASLFSQLLDLFSRREFCRLVVGHRAERYSKGYDSWDHFTAMLFCQLAQAKSVREICGGLACCIGKLRHLGLKDAPKNMAVIHTPGSYLGGSDDFMFPIYGPVRLIAQLGLSTTLPGHGGIRIGGGDIPAVSRRLFCASDVIQAFFKGPVASVQILSELVRIYYRIIGGMGINETGVGKKFPTVHQALFHALPGNAFEEYLEGFHAPTRPGLAQHAVVGNVIIRIVSQKPQPIQTLRDGGCQFTLRPDIVEHRKKHHLEDNRRGHGNMAVQPIGMRNSL